MKNPQPFRPALALAVLLLGVEAPNAQTQTKPAANTRGITVKERLPEAPPAVATPAPIQVKPPAAAAPAAPPPGAPAPAPSVASPTIQPSDPLKEAASPGPPALQPPPVSAPSTAVSPLPPEPAQAANSAGVRLELVGGHNTFKTGDNLTLRITTEKAGYLIVLDVAQDGRVTQIYPNVLSLAAASKDGTRSNFIKPGSAVLVPDPQSELGNFDFVASPPTGTGMLVAVISDKPVQIVDLPAVPAEEVRRLEFVQRTTRSLKVTPAGGGPFLDPRWSFDAKSYTIID